MEGVVNLDWCFDYMVDVGYGSEENYELLDKKGYIVYVKYFFWY